MTPSEHPKPEVEPGIPAASKADRQGFWLLPEGWLLAVLLLAGLACLKLSFNPGLARNFLDGNYYFQIAQHVERGEGLATRVSLYHQGLKTFPHEVNVAPIWPLALGYLGRLIDLWKLCEWLPELLYLVGLALLFLVADRLLRQFNVRPESTGSRWRPTPAHLAMLSLGLNPVFFEFTSAPYTEALAFTGLFVALLLLNAYDSRPSLGLAAMLGLVSALIFMTRGQLVGIGFALVITISLALRFRRIDWTHLLLAGGTGFVALLPWVAWMSGWARPWKPWYLVAAGSYRETLEVLPFQSRVPTSGLSDRVLELLEGLRVSFSWSDPDSYAASFGPSIFVLPLALVPLVQHPERVRTALKQLGARGTLLPAGVLLAGIVALAPVHTVHGRFFKEWLFGFRHGLPFVLLLTWAIALLFATGGRAIRIAALVLIAWSFVGGARETARLLGTRYVVGLSAQEHAALAWLASEDPDASIVTTRAQTLAPYSRNGIHWMECRESPDQTMALLKHAGADFVLVYPEDLRCRFARLPVDDVEVAARFGAGAGVLVVLRMRQ